MPGDQICLTVYLHVEGCVAEGRPVCVIDALQLLSMGHIHLQKISNVCVFYLRAPHRWHYSKSGNKENVVKPILIDTDPGTSSAFSRDCCCEGAGGDTVRYHASVSQYSTERGQG